MDFLKRAQLSAVYEIHFSFKDTHKLKLKDGIKILHAKGNQKRAGAAIQISDKIDFNSEGVTRDKEVHCIMIREDNDKCTKENIKTVNIYAPNSRVQISPFF